MARRELLKEIGRGVGIAIKGIGKALKASKRKARRKRLGLPEKTISQLRSKEKVKESAKKFVERRKQLRGRKPKGPSTKEVMGFSTAVGGTAAAGIYAKKKKK